MEGDWQPSPMLRSTSALWQARSPLPALSVPSTPSPSLKIPVLAAVWVQSPPTTPQVWHRAQSLHHLHPPLCQPKSHSAGGRGEETTSTPHSAWKGGRPTSAGGLDIPHLGGGTIEKTLLRACRCQPRFGRWWHTQVGRNFGPVPFRAWKALAST